MNDAAASIDLTGRESFSHWVPVTIRFSDQDSLGHVNNVAIVAYVESCRTMLIRQFLDAERHPELDYALVNVSVDYRAEFHYPGTVDVGGRILGLGNKSFTSGYGLFVGEKCVATATSTNVFFDLVKRASVVPPEDVRAALVASVEGKSV